MREQIFDKAAERYGLQGMLAAVPGDRGELVVGFTPWAEDTEGWARSVKSARPQVEGERPMSRTVWDHPEEASARVAIDVYECDSAEEAVRALVEVLAANQLATVPRGPEDLGLVSFVQPEDLPPAVMMVQANLCLVVSSFGRSRVEAVSWARRLDARIRERPQEFEETEIFGEPDRIGDEVAVAYRPRWRVGEEGYFKFFSEGGTLQLRDGQLVARGEEVTVDAYVVEPGRPSYHSRTTLGLG